MDRGSTEVEIHCACAWEPDGGRWQLNEKRSRVIVDWRQVAWCRLHMEAEIAKQGQTAGAVAKGANPNVDGAQTGSGTAKKAGTA